MANVSFTMGTDNQIEKVPISQGQVLITTDTAKMYVDINDTTRLPVQGENSDNIDKMIDDAIENAINNGELKGKDGYSVVKLVTGLRKYSNSEWETFGAVGYQDFWNSVSNAKSLKIGDIAILEGLNTTTNSNVLLFGEITDIQDSKVFTTTKAIIQGIKGDKGDKGDPGDKGEPGKDAPENLVKYYKFRENDGEVNFELKKGHMYSFTLKDEDSTSAYIVDTNGNTVTGVANKTLSGLKNGQIICADRCSCTGLTGRLSITNLNAYVADRWDWMDGSRDQYAPYYLKTTNSIGIDIWEL